MPPPDEICRLEAAYLLGELDPELSAAFEAHLATCAPCPDSLAPTLSLIADLAALQPSKRPTPPRRRGARTSRGALAVLASLLVGVVLGLASSRLLLARATPPRPAMVLGLRGDHLRGELVVYRRAWGSAIDLSAAGLPSHGTMRLVVTAADGSTALTSWRATTSPQISLETATPFAPGDIVATTIELESSHGRPVWSWHRLGARPRS